MEQYTAKTKAHKILRGLIRINCNKYCAKRATNGDYVYFASLLKKLETILHSLTVAFPR